MTNPADENAMNGAESSTTGALPSGTIHRNARAGSTRLIPSDMLPVRVWNFHAPGFGEFYRAPIPAAVPPKVLVATAAALPAATPAATLVVANAAIQAASPSRNAAGQKHPLVDSDSSDEPPRTRVRVSGGEPLCISEELDDESDWSTCSSAESEDEPRPVTEYMPADRYSWAANILNQLMYAEFANSAEMGAF
ncbi:hypothetical protein P167DRAFT_576060 [Morchella conica CCBAS932]|uniref:Uncharacterized protein n=1 Tax=Morchella conica CCBAS932 TaxID=1392247 RepID=A0A3N4KJI2_9PEZI|nr:hypothetical protein P167DRAFT_576060 [Morchella conica CCBAS932]